MDEANLHLTLKFLGEVPDAVVPEVRAALESVEPRDPISICLEGLTCLPRWGRVGVVVAKMAGDLDGLATLQADIDRRLKAIGFPQETRTFRPHVTLARRRGSSTVSEPLRKSVADSRGPSGKPFLVDSFVLMSSKLNPTGSIYTLVARFLLTSK